MGVKKYGELLKRHSVLFENFTYISILQIFIMVSPLITYPYLMRVLGSELYGWVITAQIVASYGSILVDFGFKSVSAKHVSLHRENKAKLSEIVSSILTIRFFLWLCSLIVYLGIIRFIPLYREHFWLFFFSFGITFNELLFPQFYFQGVERMKYITVLNIIIRSVFVVLTFFCIRRAEDYVLVPLLLTIGYFIGGTIALYIIFFHDRLSYRLPSRSDMRYYFKDAAPIFCTDVICTIKDKLNYILLGAWVGVGNVVVYDLGSKFTNVILKPAGIVGTVLFPKIAKERNVVLFRKITIALFFSIVALVALLNLFLQQIVGFFMAEEIDLLPIRLYSLVPLIVGISGYIASNLMIALGYNKYILYSILVTTTIYLFLLGGMYWGGCMNSVISFVWLTLLSYLGELIYRLIIGLKIIKNETDRKSKSVLPEK
ncbi:MAG: oligosaccharide flippase family protein [Odoribacter splanchnicus]